MVAVGLPLLLMTKDRVNRVTFAISARIENEDYCGLFTVDDLYPNLFVDRLESLLKNAGVPLVVAAGQAAS